MTRWALNALLKDAPMTLGIAIGAIIVSVHWWQGNDISGLALERSVHAWEPWRYVTSALPHVGILHLAFNVAWLGYFGFILERAWGSVRFVSICALLAAGSAAAEFALARGGVGLSGVVYGLFALLWVLSRREPRFHGVVGPAITWLFVGWFFFCIMTTVAGTFEAGNIAHAGGAVLGLLLGLVVTATPQAMRRQSLLVAACWTLFIVGAVVGRPYINFSSTAAATELAFEGYEALLEEDFQRGIDIYRRLTEIDPNEGDHWYNLGYALASMHRFTEAAGALERSVELNPHDHRRRSLLAWSRAWDREDEAYRAYYADDFERSASVYEEAIAFEESIPEFWHGLGCALASLGRYDEAAQAFRRAHVLDPLNDEYLFDAAWAEARRLAELAYGLLVEGEYGRSVTLYRGAVRFDKDVAHWWHNLGYGLTRLERWDEARLALLRAIVLDPEFMESQELLEWLDWAEADSD